MKYQVTVLPKDGEEQFYPDVSAYGMHENGYFFIEGQNDDGSITFKAFPFANLENVHIKIPKELVQRAKKQ